MGKVKNQKWWAWDERECERQRARTHTHTHGATTIHKAHNTISV